MAAALSPKAHATTMNSDEAPENLTVLKFSFGGLRRAANGNIELIESREIRRKGSDGFGWAMKLAPRRSEHRWKEALYLPRPAPSWQSASEGIRYENGGRVAIREGPFQAGEEFLSQLWSLDASDPAGRYRLVIFVDGDIVESIDFRVVD
jgi:hypothetical protein